MRTSRMIRSLPLPAGGHSRYLTTLRECLGWLDATEGTTIEMMETWVGQQYGVKQSTANIYVRILAVLDLMRKRSQGIEISRFGQILLHAPESVVRQTLTVLLMKKYEGFEVTLRLIVDSHNPIALEQIAQRLEGFFPRWGSLSAYRERLLWQRSLLLIEPVDSSETYRATPLGKKVADEVDGSEHQLLSKGAWLTERIEMASTDGENSETFEVVVKQAFEFLGFNAKHIGGRGNTDVLVTANYRNFRAIVDSKARADRLNQFDPYALQEHKDLHNAEYGLIVSPNFGGGRVIRQAESHKIALLPVAVLCEWLLNHEETPFSLAENISMFEQIGLIEELPEIFTTRHEYQQHMSRLLLSLFRLLDDTSTSQLGISWTADSSLHGALVIQSGESFTYEDVQQALDLLQHPTVQTITVTEDGVLQLNMTWQTFVARLSSLVQMLSRM